ncbi:MAG: glutamyl-tRNA synthetase, partial [Patescibacteria group bacterium]|nr:glutamyl-tRNA synthetase [Patescibacteria group bacterium]
NLVWKNSDIEQTKTHVNQVLARFEGADFSSPETIKGSLWDYAEKVGKGDVLWPTRYALSGKDKSPDPFTLAYILGKTETLERIKTAYKKLTGEYAG